MKNSHDVQFDEILMLAARRAVDFLHKENSSISPELSADELRAALGSLSSLGEPANEVLTAMADSVERCVVRSGSSRYFGFVIGGATPVSIASDWLTSAWDQNAQAYTSSPAAAVVEEVVAHWLLELLRLPEGSSVGFVTGAQAANFTALCAARNTVLKRVSWDFDRQGLVGAPAINAFMCEEGHATVRNALRMAGIGSDYVRLIASDEEGRIDIAQLHEAMSTCPGPKIVCAQAGNVNTGAFDDFSQMAEIAREMDCWLHVDGAFGLWAAASEQYSHLVEGCSQADSWSVDAHKWMNVPYDSGMVVLRDPLSHRDFKSTSCAYVGGGESRRNGSDWVPENSRRARGFVLYAALKTLGTYGVARIVERSCEMAKSFSEQVPQLDIGDVLNDVSLNQVLLRLKTPSDEDPDAYHHSIAQMIQRDGECWVGTGRWKGQPTLRLSFSNWQTSEDDVAATLRVLERVCR